MEQKLTLKGLEYDAKVLIAWGESISGNKKITEFLMKNFTELGVFHYALRNETRARNWLLENKKPHLMAIINGIEGNKEALHWLKQNGFFLLHEMALVGDGDNDAFERLLKTDFKIFALLAKKMETIKNEIDARNNDPHYYKNSN